MTTKESSLAGLLSDRYAYALYDLATEENKIEKIIEDLEQLLVYYNKNIKFSLLLNSPLISSDDKLKVLSYLLKIQEYFFGVATKIHLLTHDHDTF